ncbi:MAG: GH3 auxin-responsive promoter family protein [Opitutaceae bacterium]|nr:GH3 auxin-responsive promoter family protein [Opitutaceae bacterium]
MTLVPRFLLSFFAGIEVSRFARQQKAGGRGHAAQLAAFRQLMTQFAGTELGRTRGLSAGTGTEEFREQVPLQRYEAVKPLVERMALGEPDVLTPGRCPFFVETAGTTGSPKLLPVPEPMLAHFRQGVRDAVFQFAARAGHAGVFTGRHVHLGASTALREARGAFCTSFDGIVTLSLSRWAEANLYLPGDAVGALPEGPEKFAAAARATAHRDVTLLGGTPAAIFALADAVREAAATGKQRMTHLQAVWPNLECCLFTGAPLGLFAEPLRAGLGPTVQLHEVYAAAEGFFAAQDDSSGSGLRLFADAGIYFEFLPLRYHHEGSLERAGAQCVPLEQAQTGVDYVMVVTTPAGLCRYVTEDVVRFVTLDPPRLQFVGRTAFQLNSFGERVSERELLETLQAVCTRNGWQPVSFHVAPIHHRIAAGQAISAHEWWLELRTHTIKTPTANVLSPEFDTELSRRNGEYAARRAKQALDAPAVRLVMPGVFDQWAREHQKTSSASKMPRCRSDRLIADQLAALTRFHQATLAPFPPNTPSAKA